MDSEDEDGARCRDLFLQFRDSGAVADVLADGKILIKPMLPDSGLRRIAVKRADGTFELWRSTCTRALTPPWFRGPWDPQVVAHVRGDGKILEKPGLVNCSVRCIAVKKADGTCELWRSAFQAPPHVEIGPLMYDLSALDEALGDAGVPGTASGSERPIEGQTSTERLYAAAVRDRLERYERRERREEAAAERGVVSRGQGVDDGGGSGGDTDADTASSPEPEALPAPLRLEISHLSLRIQQEHDNRIWASLRTGTSHIDIVCEENRIRAGPVFIDGLPADLGMEE